MIQSTKLSVLALSNLWVVASCASPHDVWAEPSAIDETDAPVPTPTDTGPPSPCAGLPLVAVPGYFEGRPKIYDEASLRFRSGRLGATSYLVKV